MWDGILEGFCSIIYIKMAKEIILKNIDIEKKQGASLHWLSHAS